MVAWVVGDIHGCSDELAELVTALRLTPSDRLISLGDLFHRGPDPVGVMDQLQELGAAFILGNHEHRVLRRFGLAPERTDASDRPSPRSDFPQLDRADLAGDGRTVCHVAADRCADMLEFLQGHSGYYIEASDRADSEPAWCVVHAGIVPGKHPSRCKPGELISLRRLDDKGPYWYEVYRGGPLILFGHTPNPFPREHMVRGRRVALGLDTGCVYGGSLTAYSPELDEFRHVRAKRAYVEKRG